MQRDFRFSTYVADGQGTTTIIASAAKLERPSYYDSYNGNLTATI
jgi:hypothetical protein